MPATGSARASRLGRLLVGGAVLACFGLGVIGDAASAHPWHRLRPAHHHGHRYHHPRVKHWLPVVGRGHPRAERVAAVLRAARAALGTRYVYAGERLHHGFDCSGLTQWAWRHGDIELPRHSSWQWEATGHIGRKHVQPGDLLFFYRPIEHVTLYIGHGRMIEAAHTGTRVRVHKVYWRLLSGTGRPGLLPLDRRRRLARHVVHHAIHARHLRHDAARDALKHLVRKPRPFRGHRVLRRHSSKHHRVLVRAAVAHNSHPEQASHPRH